MTRPRQDHHAVIGPQSRGEETGSNSWAASRAIVGSNRKQVSGGAHTFRA